MTADGGGLRRAITLMSATAVIVPLVGLAVAPILARALSPSDRGLLSAAIAPATLMLSVATLGLPDALTFFVARSSKEARGAALYAAGLTALVGAASLLLVLLAAPYLSGGSQTLAMLLVVAAAISVPALIANVVRGVASGLLMWRTIAVERLILGAIRLVAMAALFATGHLTLLPAVLVTVLSPMFAAVVYLPLACKLMRERAYGRVWLPGPARRRIRTYGLSVWSGSVANMLFARASQLLMVPLSSSRDLGLFSVAITVADLPLVLTLAVQTALFGLNSRDNDIVRLTAVGRLLLLMTLSGTLLTAVTLPLWLGLVFGAGYAGATIPAIILLLAAALSVPGVIAGTALSAWGRPGLRSVGFGIALVINLSTFVVLVPTLGVNGAALSGILCQLVLSVYMVNRAALVTGAAQRDFWIITNSDLQRARYEVTRALRRFRRRDLL